MLAIPKSKGANPMRNVAVRAKPAGTSRTSFARRDAFMISERADKPLVAIVDDDESVCRALTRFLLTCGMSVETFTSSRAFAALIFANAAFTPDCVILDLNMPGLDGIAVQKEIVRHRPRLPIVILTGCGDSSARAQALAAGALAVFDKPLYDEIESFADTIQRAVTR
jgi:FixJ family two-component response regulator